MVNKIQQESKHVLRRLREIIGGSQKTASDDLGIATDTCASIESGRARITPAIARRIATWTGASEECLLNGKGTLTTIKGKKYTRAVFERTQVDKKDDALALSNPANVDSYRFDCLKLFRSLAIKLAGLMLAAHTSRKVGFIDARLDNEMRRLAKLLRQEGSAMDFKSLAWKKIENMDAGSEAGMVAIFDLLKQKLPAAKSPDDYLKWPTTSAGKNRSMSKPAKPTRH